MRTRALGKRAAAAPLQGNLFGNLDWASLLLITRLYNPELEIYTIVNSNTRLTKRTRLMEAFKAANVQVGPGALCPNLLKALQYMSAPTRLLQFLPAQAAMPNFSLLSASSRSSPASVLPCRTGESFASASLRSPAALSKQRCWPGLLLPPQVVPREPLQEAGSRFSRLHRGLERVARQFAAHIACPNITRSDPEGFEKCVEKEVATPENSFGRSGAEGCGLPCPGILSLCVRVRGLGWAGTGGYLEVGATSGN